MNYQSLHFGVDNGVATVTLNDPARLNALTFTAYEELEMLTQDLISDDSVEVVVLTGAGSGFCSGGNVKELIGKLVEMEGNALLQFTRRTANVVKAMRQMKKPIIAAVNGIAAGAGAMLALASDIRIFSDQAKISFLFVKVGLSGADMGALYLLPRLVGHGRAAELLFMGDSVDAEEACRIGLANRVVPHDRLMEEAYGMARRLKEGPLYAIGVTKEGLQRIAEMAWEDALEAEARAQARCMEQPDFIEGYRAFLEKRLPVFNRR